MNTKEARASTITTQSLVIFDPMEPEFDDIHIEDIAHALSHICRANGHFFHFYSVAQHSLNCAFEALAREYSPREQLACLIHDASEAYLGDLVEPIKSQMPKYRKAEKALQNMIYGKYLGSTLSRKEQALVDEIDDAVLEREFKVLLDLKPQTAGSSCKARLSFSQVPFEEIRFAYTKRFYELRDETTDEKAR
jgi:hypothetical protein